MGSKETSSQCCPKLQNGVYVRVCLWEDLLKVSRRGVLSLSLYPWVLALLTSCFLPALLPLPKFPRSESPEWFVSGHLGIWVISRPWLQDPERTKAGLPLRPSGLGEIPAWGKVDRGPSRSQNTPNPTLMEQPWRLGNHSLFRYSSEDSSRRKLLLGPHLTLLGQEQSRAACSFRGSLGMLPSLPHWRDSDQGGDRTISAPSTSEDRCARTEIKALIQRKSKPSNGRKQNNGLYRGLQAHTVCSLGACSGR